MKIVFLDAATVGKDVSLDGLRQFGETVFYDATKPGEAASRVADCDIVITNKVKVYRDEIDAARNLKLICVAATGVNCVDVDYAASKGIPVKNVPAYSTESVAQVCFMHILNMVGHGMYFNEICHDGRYSRSGMFSDVLNPFWELKGKKMGVIGMGNIGSRVAELATAFGMEVSYYSTSGTGHCRTYPCVSLEVLLGGSDVVSVNCPLNPKTKDLITYAELGRMKPGAYIVNCSRGGPSLHSRSQGPFEADSLAAHRLDQHRGPYPLSGSSRGEYPHLPGERQVGVYSHSIVAGGLDEMS